MIKINDILESINTGLKTHYFKDITTYGVCDLVVKKDLEDKDVTVPAFYTGDGQYSYVLEDTNGLIIYYRILKFTNDEDLESGVGRDSLTTENYEIRAIFYGQQIAIEQSCEDINLPLAKEFKKLIPRRVDLVDTNRIVVKEIIYNKETLKKEEFTPFSPDSVLFAIDLDITIKGIEQCNELNC